MPDTKVMTESAKKAFGQRVRMLRTKRNMEVAELAEILRVTNDSVRKYERGDRTPELWQMIMIAAVFGVTLDYLLTGSDKAPSLQQALMNMGRAAS